MYQTFHHEQDITQGQFFKQSLAALKSEFSFSLTSCNTKVKEPNLPYYFIHSWKEKSWVHPFLKGSSFPSPRLVAIPRLKSPVCPTICP